MAFVDKAGDTMTGPLVVKATVTAGDQTQSAPVAFVAAESTHASGSKRASVLFGNGWNVGQDLNATGTRDFYVYDSVTGAVPLKIGTDDIVTFPKPSKITTASIDQDGVCNVGYVSGIDDTGTSNVSAAFQVCLDKIAARPFGGTLRIPAGGRFRLDTQLNYTADAPIGIVSEGGRKAATLIQNSSVLFNLANASASAPTSSAQDIEISGLYLITNSNNSTAFNMTNPESVCAHKIRGAAGSGYWGTFFNCTNVRTSTFSKMYVRNDHGLGTAADVRGLMFRMDSTAGSTDNRFEALTIQGFDTAYYVVTTSAPGIEGQICDGVAIVGCNNGIIWANQATSGYVPPQFQFLNGHMNCFKTWVQASKTAQVTVAHNTMELNSKFGNTDSGIIFTDVVGYDISDNMMYYTEGNRAASPIVLAGASEMGSIHDIKGVVGGAPYVVQLLGGTKNSDVHDVGCYGPTINAVGNGGTNNSVSVNNRILT